jgi:hypothetical protein
MKQQTQCLLRASFTYFPTRNMKAVNFPETSLKLYRNKGPHIPDESRQHKMFLKLHNSMKYFLNASNFQVRNSVSTHSATTAVIFHNHFKFPEP